MHSLHGNDLLYFSLQIEVGSDHPATFLEKLKNPELQGEERLEIFKSLKVLLTSKPVR